MKAQLTSKWGLGSMIAAVAIVSAVEAADRTARVPDFSGAWQSKNAFALQDPPTGPGPVGDLEGYSHFGFGVAQDRRAENSTPYIANYKSPVLTPWAAAILKEKAEAAINGKEPFWAASNCWPGGMASVLWGGPHYFIQTDKVVFIVYSRDHDVRRVYLNQQHSSNIAPSWYGESVGHYDGNTLVIDTRGFNGKTSIDRYGIPHSDQLHVIERYRVLPDGRTLEGTITYEDPQAYTTRWSANVRYNRAQEPLSEVTCAEGAENPVTGRFFALPIAESPDF